MGALADSDVARYEIAGDTDDVDGADISAGTANRGSHLTERAGAAGEFNAQGQTVAGAGRGLHICR